MIPADPNCPFCCGSGIDPGSNPDYHPGAPGVADPTSLEPCECVLRAEVAPDPDKAAGQIAAFLDARGPARHNVIATAGPRGARYAKPRLRADHLRAVLVDRERLKVELQNARESVQITRDVAKRLRAETLKLTHPAGACPTPCDGDCDADCHEWHAIPAKRTHQAPADTTKEQP